MSQVVGTYRTHAGALKPGCRLRYRGIAMDTERWHRVEALFAQALELPEAERASFIASACGDDVEIQGELTALLASAPASGAWLRDAIAVEVKLLASDAPGDRAGHLNLALQHAHFVSTNAQPDHLRLAR